MKKGTALLLTLMMCMTLAGCSEKEEKKAAASLTFKDKEVEVMQGDEVNVKDFVKNVEGKVKYPKLDTSEAGEQRTGIRIKSWIEIFYGGIPDLAGLR